MFFKHLKSFSNKELIRITFLCIISNRTFSVLWFKKWNGFRSKSFISVIFVFVSMLTWKMFLWYKYSHYCDEKYFWIVKKMYPNFQDIPSKMFLWLYLDIDAILKDNSKLKSISIALIFVFYIVRFSFWNNNMRDSCHNKSSSYYASLCSYGSIFTLHKIYIARIRRPLHVV